MDYKKINLVNGLLDFKDLAFFLFSFFIEICLLKQDSF